MRFLTNFLLDILLGLHVYTYPRSSMQYTHLSCKSIRIERPNGFRVTEIVNSVDLKDVFERLSKSSIQIDGEKMDNEYCVYVTKKQNIDSMSLGQVLKSSLNCKDFELLGLKDAHAIAYQTMILYGCRKHKNVIKIAYDSTVVEAYLWFCSRSRPVFMHNSNNFDIEIAVDSHEAFYDLISAINMLKDHEYQFLNFFGYQRFGSRRPITHILGKTLINRDFELFFKVLCEDPLKTSTGLYRSLENRLCQVKKGRDIGKELRYLLKDSMYSKIIKLFVNAYQAYLFNRLLSRIWFSIVELHNVKDGLHILRREFRYIPLPGYNVYVGENVRKFFDEIMEIEGIDIRMFCPIELKGLCFYGDYREPVTKAVDFSYKIEGNVASLAFSLLPGSYATVLLREIIRCDPISYT